MSEAMPPKDKGCHRTGFEKKCRHLVMEGICDRWRTLTVADSTGNLTEKGDCIDDWAFYWGFANERGLNQSAASTDKVANKVEELQNEVSRGQSVNAIMRAVEINAGLLDKPKDEGLG